MSLHRLGHMEDDHCEACGAPDDGTQSYCECGEPLIDPKHIDPAITAERDRRMAEQQQPADPLVKAVAEWEAKAPDDEAREVVAALTREATRMADQLGKLAAETVKLQRRLDVIDRRIDHLLTLGG